MIPEGDCKSTKPVVKGVSILRNNMEVNSSTIIQTKILSQLDFLLY